MSNLSDKQWEAMIWLSRTWGKENEIESYERRKANIISSLSGIGHYDDTFIPTQTGENSTETKNIEYALMNQKIEKLIKEIAEENVKTIQVIDKIQNPTMHGMLFDKYINRMSWNQIQSKYHYAERQPYRIIHKGLTLIRDYIPNEWVLEAIEGSGIERG